MTEHVHINFEPDGSRAWEAADGSSRGELEPWMFEGGMTMTVWDDGRVSWRRGDGQAVGSFPAPK